MPAAAETYPLAGVETVRTGSHRPRGLLIRFFPGFGGGHIDVLNLDVDGNETLVHSVKTSCFHTRTRRQISGTCSQSGMAELRSAIQTALDAGITKSICDFRYVGACSSSFLGELVALSQEVQAAGGEVVIANLTRKLADIFERLKLTPYFTLANSMEEAIATLSSRECPG